jgi:hypothetical protein
MHYADPAKWAELKAKQAGVGNTPQYAFYNEVLGESFDTAAKLVSLTELNAVSNLGPCTLHAAREAQHKYVRTALAIDWGGGGEKQISFTTLAFLGMLSNGNIDVLWGKRLLTPHDHMREAQEIQHHWNYFRPTILAHDYTGAGSLRETFLIQSGIPAARVMPCMYVRSASQKPCRHIPPTQQHPRSHYRVDKSRTLLLTCTCIKCKAIHFFDADYKSPNDTGLIRDFLALIEEKTTTMAASEVYRIDRQAGMTDDFAQAVNIGCVALWHASGNWPDLGKIAYYNLAEKQLRAAMPAADTDWDDDVIVG